ncbi:hypothetical protein [Kitasatospora mediocidica]|uniref:hypothetical protein n=1 Tax=Kitasatospora mediocidica TaxID=58352 RepID=UPI0007C87962|nr:hypothetical protein [Kitasatospora mediocidica]
MTAETSAPASVPTSRPLPLLVGAALSAAEGAALAGWGIYMSVAGLVEDTRNQGLNEFGGFVILLLGLLPLFAAWGLLRLRSWGRSPSVLVHTLCLPVGYFMLQTGGAMAALGVLVALAGVVGTVALLTPRVTGALYR